MSDSEGGDDLSARLTALEQENAELRARLALVTRESEPQITLNERDATRRSRVAKLLLAGGAVAILGGVFAGSGFAIICGVGWMLGGGAVASTVLPANHES